MTAPLPKLAPQLDKVLSKPGTATRLSRADITFMLQLEDEKAIQALFEVARALRRKHFGERIFTYGFVYTGTFCRNNCTFCYFRQSNNQPQRYRKPIAEIVEVANSLAATGVDLIDLTMGEDPQAHGNTADGFADLIEMVRAVRTATGLPVMASPGVVPDAVLPQLAAAGASWYACYQETHNPALFKKLRVGQDYWARLEKKRTAHAAGLLIEEGILCGVGESETDIADSIESMRALDADQIRVMKFVPQAGTPLVDHPSADSLRECLIIAVLRLCFPDRLIPASLDVDGLAGLRIRMDAGANVVTSLVPPEHGLAGVAQSDLDIENAKRTLASIRPELAALGLKPATADAYAEWVTARQQALASERLN